MSGACYENMGPQLEGYMLGVSRFPWKSLCSYFIFDVILSCVRVVIKMSILLCAQNVSHGFKGHYDKNKNLQTRKWSGLSIICNFQHCCQHMFYNEFLVSIIIISFMYFMVKNRAGENVYCQQKIVNKAKQNWYLGSPCPPNLEKSTYPKCFYGFWNKKLLPSFFLIKKIATFHRP